MEAQRLCGGGILHASPHGGANVASQPAETQDMPVTPKPSNWQSGNMTQPVFDIGSMECVTMDENEGQERWQPGGSSRAPSRASEARSGIRQRKALQKSLFGRPKYQTHLLDVSKQAQVLTGALEAAQTQQQEMYQIVQEQAQAHLAEELSNWRAEQQIHEEIYLEWITNLEQEVSKLRTKLTEAQHTVQQPGPVRQNTLETNAQLSQTNQHNNNKIPKTREMISQKEKQKPTFADLAALLSSAKVETVQNIAAVSPLCCRHDLAAATSRTMSVRGGTAAMLLL